MRIRKARSLRNRPKGVTRVDLWRFEGNILDSEAFYALNSGAEIKILMGFLRRRRYDKHKKRYVNLDDIVYTIDSMQFEAGVSKAQALHGRNSLIQLGFIEVKYQASGNFGTPNYYKISDRWRKWHPDHKKRQSNGFVQHPPLKSKQVPPTAFKKGNL